MTRPACPSYAGYRFPAEIISHAVWLYFRFPLSLCMVDELLAARGIVVSYETVRQWARKFGQGFANVARQLGWPVVLPHPKMFPRRRELSQPNAPWFPSPSAVATPSQDTADARSDVPVGTVADPPFEAGRGVKRACSLRPIKLRPTALRNGLQ